MNTGIEIKVTISSEVIDDNVIGHRGILFSRIAQEIATEFPGAEVEVVSTGPSIMRRKALSLVAERPQRDISSIVNAALDAWNQGL